MSRLHEAQTQTEQGMVEQCRGHSAGLTAFCTTTHTGELKPACAAHDTCRAAWHNAVIGHNNISTHLPLCVPVKTCVLLSRHVSFLISLLKLGLCYFVKLLNKLTCSLWKKYPQYSCSADNFCNFQRFKKFTRSMKQLGDLFFLCGFGRSF